MHPPQDKLAILTAMAKIPGLADLEIPLEDLQSTGELLALEDAMNIEFESALKTDITALAGPNTAPSTPPAPAPALSAANSQRTTIRIPGPVLKAYQDRARLTGTKYQSLIIKTLRAAAAGW